MALTLKRCLDDYVTEHCKPQRIGTARVGFAQDRLVMYFRADRNVETLKAKDIRDYRAQRLLDGVSDSTVRRELGVLQAAVRHAAREERIDHVPVIQLPDEGAPRERWFTEDEIARLMAQPMSDAARLWIVIALCTGARKSAIETVPWSRVDLVNGYIDFRDPALRVTKKRRAKVKIATELLPVLIAAKKEATGELVVGKNVYPELKALLLAIGIKEKGVACHSFKRSFVTWAALNGVPVQRIAAATATRISTLERNYLSVLPQHTADVVNSIKIPDAQP